jgi:hypothetical protein
MSGEIFTKSRDWYETRSTCFDAEAGYNYLSGDNIEFHGHSECERIEFSNVHGRCLGVFVDPITNETLAAYMATNEGIFLVKNPMEREDCPAGKTNALRYNEQGQPELFYHKQGRDWSFARIVKTSAEQGEDDVEIFELTDDFPGIHYIKSRQELTIESLIADLRSYGYSVSDTMTLQELLVLISEQPYTGRKKGFAEVLERVTTMYIQENDSQ